jgi:hypothetical protein
MRGVRGTALPTLGAVLVLCLPAVAWSNDSDEIAEARKAPRRARSAQVLLDMDDAVRTQQREPGGAFRIRKRYGFEYAHRFDSQDGPPVIFSIQGPAMPRKRLGLSLEIRF